MLNRILIVTALFSAPVFAAGTYPALSPSSPDYSYFASVAQLDNRFFAAGLIDSYLDYNFKGLAGRIVGFKNGQAGNPVNLVLSINGTLFFIPAHLQKLDAMMSLRRRWDNDPGIFLIVRGYRLNRNGVEVRTAAQLKIATTDAKALPVVTFDDVEFPAP